MALETRHCRCPRLLFFLLLFTIPRRPRRLLNKGRVDEARQVVRHTVQENSEEELQAIIESIDLEHQSGQEALLSPKYGFPSARKA